MPKMAAVEIPDDPVRAPKLPSCFDQSGQGSGRGVYLRVINFDLNISEDEMD